VTQISRIGSSSALLLGVIEDISISRIRLSERCIRPPSVELGDLAISIRQKGLLQPILIRSKERGFEIIAGNRRYLACKSLGWRKVTCHVVELDDKQAFEVSMIENIQRKTLSPIWHCG
jgi:ParB family transcriptional regulator, chromosome partitioning protein